MTCTPMMRSAICTTTISPPIRLVKRARCDRPVAGKLAMGLWLSGPWYPSYRHKEEFPYVIRVVSEVLVFQWLYFHGLSLWVDPES
jgi:hypothetical protein